MAGEASRTLPLASYLLVSLTALAGVILTMTWWRSADQR
jgi:hypothetical protein